MTTLVVAAPFTMTAGTPVALTAVADQTEIRINNRSTTAIFVAGSGAASVNSWVIEPTSTLALPVSTTIDIVSPVSLPAGQVRVLRVLSAP